MASAAFETAYAAFASADDAWQAELVNAFGKRASDARYMPEGKGHQGSTLRAAYDAFCAARELWLLANRLPSNASA